MTDREVMQQALEALEGWENCDKWVWPETALEQSKRNTTESLAALRAALEQQQAEPVAWRDMIVVSLVREGVNKHKARELADHFATQPTQQAEPPPEWLLIKNILDEYGLQAIDFVAEFKAAQQVATIWKQPKQQAPFSPEAINTTQTAWRMGYEAAKAEQQAEPVCPECKAAVLYECVACSSNNYPPQQQAEPVATVTSETGNPDITMSWWHEPALPVGTKLYTTPPQQQAEPVAWDKPSDNFNEWWNGDYEDPANPFEKDSAAYWAWAGWQAAQRPWVGLTNEEIEAVVEQVANGKLVGTVQEFRIRFSRAIEAKLKEKNI